MNRRWAAAAVGALLAITGCASSSTPVAEAEAGAEEECDHAKAALQQVLTGHPSGPIELDERERDEIQLLVGALDGACPGPEAAGFGENVLEPWSMIGTTVPDRADGDPATTIPPPSRP